MKTYNTLWNILNQFGVEIPPIQRDFAQGRETDHANKVRKSFLDSIFRALQNNDFLSLDFVYGKIHGLKNEEETQKNKRAIQSLVNSIRDYALTVDLTLKDIEVEDKSSEKSDLVYLIPLDGQQRLTTLFLIHWYISKRIGNTDALIILNRFRYKTRKSSAAFLKLLIDSKLILEFEFYIDGKEKEAGGESSEKDLYDEITNSENFSTTWLNDPTVKSMLVMIQDIHLRLQLKSKEQLNEYWNGLTEKHLLWFDFLDLKDFNLSDELYLKMNARGKQLTSFENFKAWLFDLIREKELVERVTWESFEKKFDVEWNDIFWNYKAVNVFEIDKAYFNFFKLLLLYDTLKIAKLKGTNFDKETREWSLINAVTNDKLIDWENLFNEFFENNIANYLKVLSLCEDFNDCRGIDYLNNFFQFQYTISGVKPTWPDLIRNYITLSFISNKKKSLKNYTDIDFDHMNEYHRIMLNLFDNTIIDNPSLYQDAIKQIDNLNGSLIMLDYSILKWVDSFEYGLMSVFTEQQILEEILKYRLFADIEWKNIILEAEKVKYFERQLNFWFYRSSISLAKENFTSNILESSLIKKSFRDTTLKINILFNDKGIERESDFSEYIFERAVLSKSDYLLNEKGYKCFGRNSGRDVSWKRLFFRDRNADETNNALLQVFDLDFTDVKKSFNEYIDKNLFENIIEDWRRTFVMNAELFNYLGIVKYLRHIDNHGWVLIKDDYKTYIGAHYELFSLQFYLNHLKDKNFTPFNEVGYHTAPKNNFEDFPCAYLDWSTNGSTYTLDVKYIFDEYCLVFFAKEGLLSRDAVSVLNKLNFIGKNDNYTKSVLSEELVLNEIACLKELLKSDT